jgi:hypothetical protein
VSAGIARQWARPAEAPLLALWNALDEARLAVSRTLLGEISPDDGLRRFLEDFEVAQAEMTGLLLDALAPDSGADEDAAPVTNKGGAGS